MVYPRAEGTLDALPKRREGQIASVEVKINVVAKPGEHIVYRPGKV